jgi:hypothetical protein
MLAEYGGVDLWVIIPFCFSTSTVVYLLHYSHDYQLTNTLLVYTQFLLLSIVNVVASRLQQKQN